MRVRRFLLIVITLVTVGWLSTHAVWAARCDAELEVVAEPSGWHSWPLASGLAGYEVTDLEPIHYWGDGCTSPRPHGLGKPRLAGRGVCPERGAPLDSWFTRYDFYRRSAGELAVYTQPGGNVHVVTGQLDRDTSPQGEEHFVVAFRPDEDNIAELVLRVGGTLILAVLVLVAPVLLRRFDLWAWWLEKRRPKWAKDAFLDSRAGAKRPRTGAPRDAD